MVNPSMEVPLPPSVENLLQRICTVQSQSPPDSQVRWKLALIGEQASLEILRMISVSRIKSSLSGFIVHMINTTGASAETDCLSPQFSVRSASVHFPTYSNRGSMANHHMCSPSTSSAKASPPSLTNQLLSLQQLEFRKFFLILSYIGRNRLEDVMPPNDADGILMWKDWPMRNFEPQIWNDYGIKYCDKSERRNYLDWDSGKTHFYHCYVHQDGSYNFQGPCLNTTTTHLQRSLGDENVLIVKFEEMTRDCMNKIAEEGIFVGLKRYRFFVFKDEHNKGKKSKDKKKCSSSSAAKCYFVRTDSIAACYEKTPYVLSRKTIHEARCLFMHVHMVSSIAKYIARLSLILSKTIKLQVDLSSVRIERIGDIPCRDAKGCVVYDEDGEPLIHTDGTGFISEDLAMKCPKDFYKAKYIKDENFERLQGIAKFENFELRENNACTSEPPLLMQCRLFTNGCAVKGTLLVNITLPPRTIQIRPSMIKVEMDSTLSSTHTFNSLEIVAISNKPRKTLLSKNLITLLSYGGVPSQVFLEVLENALEDVQNVYTKKRAALKVALNYGEIDDDFLAARMMLSGIPLNEPCLRDRLSFLAKEARKGLRGGKLPISESYYLMGTADPTGILNRDEVCVILDNGQISGKVLVYRNPGIHFGDIHVLNAVYVEALENVVGNSKYAIFFSTKGQRSVASEIANGDFDGDVYWVSRNPKLLHYFKPSEPWQCLNPAPKTFQRKPSDFTANELEYELFQLLLETRKQSNIMGVAADSWLAFMDRLLILKDGNAQEKEILKKKMLHLVDLYYDALDAPKTGERVEVSDELRADNLPHYLEREKSCHSTSILGQIYDKIYSSQSEELPTEEISKLPCFNDEIPEQSFNLWREQYDKYKSEMTTALNSRIESKKDSANQVIKKYKQLLYDAPDFEKSPRKREDIYNEALAIYHVTYDYARDRRDVRKCSFAWKIAGHALCELHAYYLGEKPFVSLPSVLREVFS